MSSTATTTTSASFFCLLFLCLAARRALGGVGAKARAQHQKQPARKIL
jgi:hypothetical protein